jgi:PAS domain S-box-containing protein
MDGSARLDAEPAETRVARQEQPNMEFPHQRIALAFAASAVGMVVTWLTRNPLGLLAPTATLFLFARGRTVLLLYAASAIGLVGALLVAASYAGAARDLAAAWAAFFASALCIGTIVATSASASPHAVAMPAAIRSTTREQAPSYPVVGPSLREKAAPRHAPFVSISARDDKASAARLATVSFWGGMPVHIRYWRRQPDGRYRWVESRSEPLREPSGTRLWNGVTTDVDDQRLGQEPPTKTASNPPSDEDAVRAAKLVENLLGNAWAFDAAGRPTYLTPLAQTFVAVTLEEFQATVDEGHTFFKRTAHPDDYDRLSAAWRHSLQTGDPFFLDRRVRRASGIHEWNRTGFVPTRDGEGRITGWYGSMIDLDSHRIAEAELRERERELLQLVNMVPSHLWRLAPDGEPIFFSKRMVDFLGLDVADIDRPGMSRLEALTETVHPGDAAEFRDTLRRCVATGESFTMRYRLRRADGAYRWMSSRAEPMRDQDGRIVQWYGLCHDIDDQVHAEEALRERERELAQLVDMLPVYIRRLTPEGEPIFFNKRLTDFIGVDLADIGTAGTSRLWPAVENFVHPDEAAKVVAALRRAVATGEGYAMRYRMRGADGIYRWIETRAEPLRNQDGTIAQWYSVSIDIEDEARARQAEEALRETSDKLAKAAQAASLAELSASIAHEVNQPLAAIVANSHACQRWLSAEPANVERAKITVERIIRDANSAADVVSRIRALFRQSVEPRSNTTLSSLIAEARSLMAEEAARRRVRMDVDVESNLPPVTLDRVQIQQVLINLIRNGFDAMDSTRDDRALGVRARRNGDSIQIEISDRGVGIAFPDKMFEPFYTTKQDGMGMGLAICRSIVDSHGGRLWAEKNEPRGATFIFTLPVEAKTWS